MNVTIDRQGSAAIVRPAGRLDFGAAAGFQEDVDRALAGDGSKPSAVIIDCAALEYVSSAGLRVFLVGARASKSSDIAFLVCNLMPSVREVFGVSGFDRIIPVAGTIDEALDKAGVAR
ncbi:MAG: STAS domain-containing protein [Pseudomonadales bacterium]